MAFFEKIIQGLEKTRKSVTVALNSAFAGFTGVNEEFFDELEELLILADVGAETSEDIVGRLREKCRDEGLVGGGQVRDGLSEILFETLDVADTRLDLGGNPTVILVVGVNGVGKTTTIGKLASRCAGEGKSVLLCAADTFRAAAADQLEIWAGRADVGIIRQNEGSDPAAVVFDAMNAARARKVDVVICDTAGRLHNKKNLMNELSKIERVITRELPGAKRETLLVLDATTGQNGLVQAREFMDAASINGIALTKLDGTAKGGIVFAVANELKVPVKLIGVGEKQEDLLDFDAAEFVRALLA